MALDGIYLSLLRREIEPLIVGSRVDKICQPSKRELVFTLRSREAGNMKLLVSAAGSSARVGIIPRTPENPAKPPMFCMLLRKHLGGALVTGLRQRGLDRILYIDFRAVDELGDTVTRTLIVEIMAQSSNIILTDGDGVIIDCVRRAVGDVSRVLMPQTQYTPPTAQNKADIMSADTAALAADIAGRGGDMARNIMNAVEGVSPLISRELAFRSGGGAAGLQKALDDVSRIALSGKASPTILMSGDEYRDFSYMPIRQYGDLVRNVPAGDLSGVLDKFFSGRDSEERLRSRSADLFRTVDTAIARISRTVSVQREELRRSADRDKLKIYGELISANMYSLPSGVSSYTVADYYHDMKEITIPVSPVLTPSQNSQKYFHEYRKAQTAEKILGERIAAGEADLEWLAEVRYALSCAATDSQIGEIREELAQGGIVKKRSAKTKSPKPQRPLEYTSPAGFSILVGRNNTQNDTLTFRTAHKNDVWFHAQKTPGSHVVLFAGAGIVPPEDMEYAAALAAFYSQKGGRGAVTVDYTLIRNLNKPVGARPGFVTYHIYNSMVIRDADKSVE